MKFIEKSEFFNILNEKYGFKLDGDLAYAEINGYGYSLNKTSTKNYSLSTSVDLSDSKIKRKLIRRIALIQFKAKFEFTVSGKNKIDFHIRAQFLSEKFLKHLDIILNRLNDLFIQFSIQPSCWNCNRVGLFPIYHKNNSSFMLCNECVNDLRNYQTEYENELKDNSNYLSGFVGALLGASLGGFIWVITSKLGDYTYLVSFILGYLTYMGYMRFKGNRGKYMKWILFGTILLVIILTSVVETVYGLLTYPDYTFTLADSVNIAFRILYDVENFQVHLVWMHIAFATLFAILGCGWYAKTDKQKNKLLDNNPLIEFKY